MLISFNIVLPLLMCICKTRRKIKKNRRLVNERKSEQKSGAPDSPDPDGRYTYIWLYRGCGQRNAESRCA